ncbi:MAG: serine/threonine-protein phosphatase [Bryobacteraceae bacterium]|nr:serine/threonine-protein phosphatase [Bryobacteraceae bacterium]
MEKRFSSIFSLGVLLAVGLLANSIANYVFVARRIQVDQLRRDLAAQVAKLDADLQTTTNQSQVAAVLRRAQARANGLLAWAVLRDTSDGELGHIGLDVPASFKAAEVRASLRARQSSYRTRATPQGEMVVEAFVLRLPVPAATPWQTVGYAPATPRPVAVLEAGAPMEAASGHLWPLRRNLLLNCSGALALLATLVVLRLRFRAYLAGQRLAQQVEIARRVQQDLLPTPRDTSRVFELAADYRPALDLGGDFYDAFPAGAGAAFVLGDVSGKGLPAALLTGVIHGAVRASAWTSNAAQHEAATAQLNRLLSERASAERFASLFWGYMEHGTLRYINAGHLAPIVVRAHGGCTRLEEGGPVLGLLPQVRYTAATVELEPGDLLVLYSDGLVEAANAQDEQFGEERVLELVTRNRDLPAAELRDRILTGAQQFTGGAELEDDRTLLVIRVQGQAAAGRMAA